MPTLPPKPKKSNITLSLKDDNIKKLKDLAKETGYGLSEIVDIAVAGVQISISDGSSGSKGGR